MEQHAFIEMIAPMAQDEMRLTGILSSITIAQAALESAWGAAASGNNLFGIKGNGLELETVEYVNGRPVTVTAGFRVYVSWADSVTDHSRFLLENGRYRSAGFFDRCEQGDYAGAAYALQQAGYATDPQYAVMLISLIAAWKLDSFDKEVFEEMEQIREELNTLRETVERLAQQSVLSEVPEWAQAAVDAAVAKNLIDTPQGGSYDFYRLLTILHRNGTI